MAENSILDFYSWAMESFSEIDAIFRSGSPKNFEEIGEKLKQCAEKIQILMIYEEHDFLINTVLLQVKYQLQLITQIIQDKAQKKKNETQLQDIKPIPSTSKDANLPESKRRKIDDLEHVIPNTGETPKVAGLHDIVGLHDVKRTLKSLIVLPKTQPQLFENRSPCNTILLYGPPGTGKTRLVHGVAAEAKANLHCLCASDILSHYVGQTEKGIKALFQLTKNSKELAILFMDEIDGFCRKRTGNEQEHVRRMKTELMCQLSNVDNCSNLIVVGATNCPWDLDTAILRRFQKQIYVPLPNQMERLEFFQYFTQNEEIIDQSCDKWFPLLDKTEGFSGCDLSNLIQNAYNIPLNELQDTKIWKQTPNGFYEPVSGEDDFCNVICSDLDDLPYKTVKARKMNMSDLIISAENVVVTIPSSDLIKYEKFKGSK